MPMEVVGTGLGTNSSEMDGVELASKAGNLPSWPWLPMPHVSTVPFLVRMAQWRAPATSLMACRVRVAGGLPTWVSGEGRLRGV